MTSRTALPADPFRAPDRALPAKTRLDEYEIERVLAQSSFAVVYLAYDHSLRLHVAIKEYLPDALALRSAETQVVLRARGHADRFEQGLQAFVGEAQTLARGDHPSLLRILRVLQRHGTAYRVMRYAPGPTLLEHRRALGAAPDAAAMRRWLDQLLGALEALHEEGCVHGAVAPGNILLLHGGRPLLLDFDAVRTALISDRTQSIMAALEPCFQPPEQQAGAEQSMGPWSDLYSLAATLHFCISGQLPPPPGGPTAAFEPLSEAWRRLRETQPGLGEAPAWLQAVDDCLAERARDRPQSIAELRQRLDAAPPAARPPVPQAVPRPSAEPRPEAASPPVAAVPAPARAEPPRVQKAPQAPKTPSLSASPTVEALSALLGAKPQPAASAKPAPATTAAAPAPMVAAPAIALPPRPAAVSQPVESAQARKVIADLDQTFAFIAAQATEDAAQPQASAAAAAQEQHDDDADTAPMHRRQLWWLVGSAVLLLLAAGAAIVWMLNQYDPGLLRGTHFGARSEALPKPAAAQAPAGLTGPLTYPPPSAGATRPALLAAEPPAAELTPPAPPPPPAAPAAKAETPKAEAAKPAAPGSPRQACGKRERYALLQCMETQCAKKAWSQHEQCVRLRKERKL